MGISLVLSDCVDIKQLGADVGGFYNIIFNVSCVIKEGKVLFNDARNTFYLRLYGVRHMVKDHSAPNSN